MIIYTMKVTFLKCQILIVFFSVLECKKRKKRSHGRRRNGNIKRKICTEKRFNYIKQHSLQGVIFNISLVLISILRSTINEILSKFHSLAKV